MIEKTSTLIACEHEFVGYPEGVECIKCGAFAIHVAREPQDGAPKEGEMPAALTATGPAAVGGAPSCDSAELAAHRNGIGGSVKTGQEWIPTSVGVALLRMVDELNAARRRLAARLADAAASPCSCPWCVKAREGAPR